MGALVSLAFVIIGVMDQVQIGSSECYRLASGFYALLFAQLRRDGTPRHQAPCLRAFVHRIFASYLLFEALLY